jgi:ATP-dependent protease ClpP protease subunit
VLLNAAAAVPMTMTVSGDQLIATGRVVTADAARFRSLVDTTPSVKTVVLWNSPGGSASANDAITATIEEHRLDTVVAGFCVSACAMIFLSGASSPPIGGSKRSRRASSSAPATRSIRCSSSAGCT